MGNQKQGSTEGTVYGNQAQRSVTGDNMGQTLKQRSTEKTAYGNQAQRGVTAKNTGQTLLSIQTIRPTLNTATFETP